MNDSRRPLKGIGWLAFLGFSALAFVVGCGEAASHEETETDHSGPAIAHRTKRPGVSLRDTESLCWVTMALAGEVGRSGQRLRPELEVVVDRLKALQWGEGRGCTAANPYYGGTGRDERSIPDLPHTALSLQTLRRAGVPADDPYVRRAVDFILRCQRVSNLQSQELTDDEDDPKCGGFAIGPIEVASQGREGTESTQDPCGAATAMGISSLLAAGVPPKDIRVQKALRWLAAHYSLEAHPGMRHADEGLYRFYFEFATAMRGLRLEHLRDSRGVIHDWRDELERKLLDRQEPDGRWSNPGESAERARGGPMLVTSYALLTLNQIIESRRVHERAHP